MDIQEIIELVKKTKKFILNREMVLDVKERGIADYVTQVDITVQNFLKEELFILAPDIRFLGEETGLQNMNADSFWILNPVDRTTNLMHDYQHSVVSLALCQQDEIVMGIVYDPFREDIFYAMKGKGSFLNGQPIHVSNVGKLSDTMIGIGTAKRELADENFARFRRVFGQCQDIRRIGSAALELAYTACGRQGGYFEIYLNPWDYAAGMLLIQEAGGKVTDFMGGDLNPRKGGSVVGTNGYLSDTMIGIGTAKRELADENFARFRRVFGQCQDIRRIGSAALELAYTACGRQGGYFEIYLNPWDYAAGMLLIQEAGGKVTDFMGGDLNPRKGGSVVGTNGYIHTELLQLL